MMYLGSFPTLSLTPEKLGIKLYCVPLYSGSIPAGYAPPEKLAASAKSAGEGSAEGEGEGAAGGEEKGGAGGKEEVVCTRCYGLLHYGRVDPSLTAQKARPTVEETSRRGSHVTQVFRDRPWKRAVGGAVT